MNPNAYPGQAMTELEKEESAVRLEKMVWETYAGELEDDAWSRAEVRRKCRQKYGLRP